jgi:hypothetical protein
MIYRIVTRLALYGAVVITVLVIVHGLACTR